MKSAIDLAGEAGFVPNQHREENSIRNKKSYVVKVIKDQDHGLKRYVSYYQYLVKYVGEPIPTDDEVREKYLSRGATAPDLATLKDIIRYHAKSSQRNCGGIFNGTRIGSQSGHRRGFQFSS